MLKLVQSLSIHSAAGVVIFATLLFAICWVKIYRKPFRFLPTSIFSIIFSVFLYRLPVLLGADPSEYRRFAFIVIGFWVIVGLLTSLGIFVFIKLKKLVK